MLRQHFIKKGLRAESHFNWRGGDISRVEALSDAVFAFAVTLLVVSLEVPTSFAELMQSMRGFFSFGICFTLLFLIWHAHYIFYRRYGLEDTYTTILNAILLFVVLFYIYPLKFLFSFLISAMFGIDTGVSAQAMITGDDIQRLMLVYSMGFMSIFLVFGLMYLNAYRKRGLLNLNEVEILSTRASLNMHLIYVAVAVLSVALAATGRDFLVAAAGWCYALLWPGQMINGIYFGRRIEKLTKLETEPKVIDEKA